MSRWEHLEASTPYRVGKHLPPMQSHPSRPEYRESIKSFSIKSPTLSIKKKITSSTNDVNDLSQSQINKAKFKPKQDHLVYFLGRCWIGCSGNGVNHTDRTTAKAEKALEGLRTTDLCVEWVNSRINIYIYNDDMIVSRCGQGEGFYCRWCVWGHQRHLEESGAERKQ